MLSKHNKKMANWCCCSGCCVAAAVIVDDDLAALRTVGHCHKPGRGHEKYRRRLHVRGEV